MKKVANYEGLIRGALAAKQSASAEARQTVYQSSRNALKRLIEENRSMTLESALAEQRALEDAIDRVEKELSAPVSLPDSDDPLFELKQILSEDTDQFDKVPVQTETGAEPDTVYPNAALKVNQPVGNSSENNPASHGAVPTLSAEQYSENENLPLEFAKRRKTQRVVIWLLIVLAALAVVAWLAYYILTGITNNTLFGLNEGRPAQNPNALSVENQSSEYITVLEPGDLSTLTTANRGRAEIINELNQEIIRLMSVRDDNDLGKPATPFQIQFKPGVIEQISGRNVTVEIYAKSGTSSPAQFILRCRLGNVEGCGRKRFRVGLQPEALIFSLQMPNSADPNGKFFLSINTDTTESAASTGEGDVLDIVYVRLRAN